MASKFIANNTADCVACGACVTRCPKGAVTLYKGVRAVVDAALCVGCGACVKVCPAVVMTLGVATKVSPSQPPLPSEKSYAGTCPATDYEE
jgi:ferredoxin